MFLQKISRPPPGQWQVQVRRVPAHLQRHPDPGKGLLFQRGRVPALRPGQGPLRAPQRVRGDGRGRQEGARPAAAAVLPLQWGELPVIRIKNETPSLRKVQLYVDHPDSIEDI